MTLHPMPGAKRATVVKGSGADRVLVVLDAANPTWPFTGDLWVAFDVAHDGGVDYCRRLWPGMEVTVVERP